MNVVLLGMAMLVSSTGSSALPEPARSAAAPSIFSFELRERTNLPRGPLTEWSGSRRARGLVPSAAARRPKWSRMDRIIAVAAGGSIGWVLGGTIGYAVTPKRGPYDDTSGLKGMIIGAPIGAVVGALIGYRLTK